MTATIIIPGKLGRDAELRHTNSGDPVLGFPLASDERQGQDKITVWYDCSIWGRRAEALAPYLTKGAACTVAGSMIPHEYQKRDGTTGHKLSVRVSEVTLQGGRDQSQGSAPAPRQQAPARQSVARAAAPASGGEFDDSSDIPF